MLHTKLRTAMKSSYVDSLARLEDTARRNAEKRVVEAFQVLHKNLIFSCLDCFLILCMHVV